MKRKNSDKIQDDVDTYNTLTWKRIQNKTHRAPHPLVEGLVEDCLIWDGFVNTDGYGQIWYNGKTVCIHRVALMILKRVNVLPKLDSDGNILEVAHRCYIRNCCEPSHLYLATKVQNGQDQSNNGIQRGEKHPQAKDTDELARQIKLSKGSGSQKQRAERFNVALAKVKRIDCGQSWTHIVDANGKNLEEKRVKRNKQLQAKTKKGEWSKYELNKAYEKLKNPEYVKNDTNIFNGSCCVIWTSFCDVRGRPRMSFCGQSSVPAHTVACAIGNNYVREKNKFAFHECGNKSCVNPQHLKFKTAKEAAAATYKRIKLEFADSADSVDSEELIYLLDSAE